MKPTETTATSKTGSSNFLGLRFFLLHLVQDSSSECVKTILAVPKTPFKVWYAKKRV